MSGDLGWQFKFFKYYGLQRFAKQLVATPPFLNMWKGAEIFPVIPQTAVDGTVTT